MAVLRYKEKFTPVLQDTSAIKAKAQAAGSIMQRIKAFEAPVMQMAKQEAVTQAEKDFASKLKSVEGRFDHLQSEHNINGIID